MALLSFAPADYIPLLGGLIDLFQLDPQRRNFPPPPTPPLADEAFGGLVRLI